MSTREQREKILNNLFFGENSNYSFAAARTEEAFNNFLNCFQNLKDMARFGEDLSLYKYIDKSHEDTKEFANSLVFLNEFMDPAKDPEE